MFRIAFRKSLVACVLVAGNLLSTAFAADEVDVKGKGAFGFPQAESKVLCDTDELRLSVWSNASYLYVQAVLWNDDSDEVIKGADGRSQGDTSSVVLDTDADKTRTPKLDRTYDLNPWPTSPGLHYQIVVSDRGSTGLIPDSDGRGGIKYVKTSDGRTVRVDSYLIPLSEVDLKTGESIRLAYFGRSTSPETIVNSIGYQSPKRYYSFSLPYDSFHEVALSHGTTIDDKQVPEVRRARPKMATPSARPEPTLTIGSKAPALNIEHWVQDGQGKFKPITKFELGQVYIVEFWATWCGPCIAAMPHIVELQKKYADRGLQVVSISDEELDTVSEFLKREVAKPKPPAAKVESAKEQASADEKPITYGVLTSAYCLTTDPDRSCHEDYMTAAQRNGIPCAFIVGKDGIVEWIGHPMSIDSALASVLDGKWDRQSFLVEYRESENFTRRASEIMQAASKNRFAEALKLVEQAEGDFESPIFKARIGSLNASIQASQLEYMVLKNNPESVAVLSSLLKDKPALAINQIVWQSVAVPYIAGRKANQELIKASIKHMQLALEAEPESSYYLDTQAHLYGLLGEVDKALELQEKAVKSADDQTRPSIEEFLKELRSKKEAGSK